MWYHPVMQTPRSQKPTDWREGRRRRALELHHSGWKQTQIAEALGVTQGAVSGWLARAKKEGPQALRKRTSPGAPPRLTLEQKVQLPTLLSQGAESFGFVGDVWTCERVAEVIEHEWGVSYHPDHVSRVLRAWGWSQQKPIRRAIQRDDAAIQEWKEERLPALKKRPTTKATPSSL